MFHIKICGVRLKEDIDAAGDAGADAIGLNFFPASARYVDPNAASTRELAEHAGARDLIRVGVFVNEHADSIFEIANRCRLDVIQLHGDESIDDATQLLEIGMRVLRAIKLPVGKLTTAEIQTRIAPWRNANASLLLDADAGTAHGGSGKTLDWNAIREWSIQHPANDWILAGGLNPENVGQAIRSSAATSVDVASGVEESRGVKSAARIRAFTKNAQQAFSEV